MNFYLLNLFGKWVSFGILSIVSLLGFNIDEKTFEVRNSNIDKNVNVISTVIEHKTIKNYDSSIPSNITKIIKEGQDGVIYYNEMNEVVVLEGVVDEEIIIGTGKNGEYTGVITGYGPDCKTCSGRGYVSCRTENKKSFNLITDGIYYNDDEYGEVRVLAAALSEFPCGTIVEVKNSNLGDFIGIVMDTGYDMRKHLEEGIYHFDVAYETEKNEEVKKVTDMSGDIIYNVQRWGW